MTVEIRLTNGLVAIVDEEDAVRVEQHRWRAKADGRTWYAERWVPLDQGGASRWQLMHKLLTGYAQTDHINGDGLDNRRANLRPATEQQNHRNRRKTGGSSQYKGVSWNKQGGCWTAQIAVAGHRNTWLGRFSDELEAALAYDRAARAHFGEFAALNFPEPGERSALSK